MHWTGYIAIALVIAVFALFFYEYYKHKTGKDSVFDEESCPLHFDAKKMRKAYEKEKRKDLRRKEKLQREKLHSED